MWENVLIFFKKSFSTLSGGPALYSVRLDPHRLRPIQWKGAFCTPRLSDLSSPIVCNAMTLWRNYPSPPLYNIVESRKEYAEESRSKPTSKGGRRVFGECCWWPCRWSRITEVGLMATKVPEYGTQYGSLALIYLFSVWRRPPAYHKCSGASTPARQISVPHFVPDKCVSVPHFFSWFLCTKKVLLDTWSSARHGTLENRTQNTEHGTARLSRVAGTLIDGMVEFPAERRRGWPGDRTGASRIDK